MQLINPIKTVLFIGTLFIQFSNLRTFAMDPPDSVERSFKEKFPQAEKSKWTSSGEKSKGYVANFSLGKEKITAYFDEKGTFLKSEKKFNSKHLPEIIFRVLETQFQKYRILNCYEVTKHNGEKKYKIMIKSDGVKTALLMSEQGNWIPIENF